MKAKKTRARAPEKPVEPSPARGGKHPTKGKKLPAEVLTHEEAEAILGQCSLRAPTGIRNRALIMLMWGSGLRISEAVAVRLKDLDRKEGTVRVLKGKGSRTRTVKLNESGFQAIERWLDCREKFGVAKTAPVICTLKGSRLNPSYARHLFPRLAKKAGIEKRVHPHGWRHLHAVTLLRQGYPVDTIRAQLGHRNIAQTITYLARIAPAESLARLDSWGPLLKEDQEVPN